ncbi:MAG TPA: hypothetical protein VD908_19240 [Cytophagales bacterium]|nr:hypothetical protein [Cytophagales bacterium]
MIVNHPNEDEYLMAYSMWPFKNKLSTHEIAMVINHPNENEYLMAYSMWLFKNKLSTHEMSINRSIPKRG